VYECSKDDQHCGQMLWSERWMKKANLNQFVAELEANEVNLELRWGW